MRKLLTKSTFKLKLFKLLGKEDLNLKRGISFELYMLAQIQIKSINTC